MQACCKGKYNGDNPVNPKIQGEDMLIVKAESRINQYLHFLKKNRYRELVPLEFEIFETEKTYRNPPAEVKWEKIKTPHGYGKPWHCFWFRSFPE